MPERISQLSDRELVEQARAGCRQSFEKLIDRYSARLIAFVCRRVASTEDAEDIVQEALIKAYCNLHKYNNRYQFSTWLFTIAYRTAVSHFRWHRCRQFVLREERTVQQPDNIASDKDESRKIWRLAEQLSKNQQQALWLRYHEEMDITEIATVMGKSRVNVKVLLHRGRTKLADMLNDQPENELTYVTATPNRSTAVSRGIQI